MTILILTLGSRGDVQPYLALGRGLEDAGHDVTVSTSASFASFVRNHGLSFHGLTDGFIDLMQATATGEAMEELATFRGFVRHAPRLWRASINVQRELNDDAWDAARAVDPDLILYHPKMYIAPHVAERLRVPCAIPFVIPMCAPTSRFPSPGFPTIDVLPDRLARVYNRLTYLFARGLTQLATRGFVRRWRRSVGLDASPERTSLYRQHTGAPAPIVYGFSRHLVPRPPDWPAHVRIAGPWPLEKTSNWSPPVDLERFLADGPAPVYVGFGSMRGRDPRGLANVVIRALQAAGVRGVLSSGWGGLEAEDLPADMIRVDDVPHDWLFPRMRAVVHHGGAGTTHTGLRAGRPTVICPFMADQPFWGRVVRDRGLGPAPIRQVDLTVTSLARAIRLAINDRAMQRDAARIGARMQQEKGIRRAVELMEAVAEDARTG